MKLNIFFVFFIFFSINKVQSQLQLNRPSNEPIKAPSSITKADKDYEKFAYVDAIKTYERIADKGYKSVEMFQKLGNSYYFNAELENAAKWYKELFAMNLPIEAEYYYRYSQCLKSIGDYKKADAMMAEFNTKSGNDERAILFEKNKNYLQVIKSNSGRFIIEDAGINSAYSDYGTAISENQIVFASAREVVGVNQKKMQWTGQSFTNLFGAELKSDGTLGSPNKFNRNLNSKFNESTPVFTRDGQTMYFTRNNFINGKRARDEKKVTLLKLYKATKNGNDWENITELSFNSDQYSTAHPVLSLDEKTLYFASDMPGTLGQSDLWKSTINDDGSFGTPQNLGKDINTPGRETFPFISAANELYYATDGRPGLGGLDIFVAQLEKDESIRESINIGAPINSKKDDFGLLMDNKSRSGFFTSNRDGGLGDDDIYRFTETKKLACDQLLAGNITDFRNGETINDVEIILQDSKFNVLDNTISDAFGNYSFNVSCGQKYFIKANKKDYRTAELSTEIDKISGKTNLPIKLDKKVKKVTAEDDIAIALGIKMIYFDLNKSIIRLDAAIELEKILDVMNTNPTMTIDVRSHTDSRQTSEYNLALSSRRAKSTAEWLITKGIKRQRLTSQGFGESKLTNRCADGVECTEEEHQLNRRSEFIITAM